VREVATDVTAIRALVDDVSMGSHEQAGQIHEITQAMSTMTDTTNRNAEDAERTPPSRNRMSQEAEAVRRDRTPVGRPGRLRGRRGLTHYLRSPNTARIAIGERNMQVAECPQPECEAPGASPRLWMQGGWCERQSPFQAFGPCAIAPHVLSRLFSSAGIKFA